jgi:CDP-diacylglycerol--glycerol-3-phosphate 3-phosphatidyltransferase
VQNFFDDIIEKIFFKIIPLWLKPNYFTVLRIILIPFTLYFLFNNNYLIGFVLFVIAASTDFLDGALARRRNQISEFGKVADPIADKLLILSVFIYIGFDYLVIRIFVIFIIVEIITVLTMAFFPKYFGKSVGANLFGKIKMVLQSFGVLLFLVGLILNKILIIEISELIILVAFGFAVLAAFKQALVLVKSLKI